ncbi:MAG TPA: glycosyltransferase family 2 protein [Gemmatimonadales bacterium]|nr:glycosyltransferase family 2 protein [Gemmatimonadales bacterium]
MSTAASLSVVVPLYNEEDNVRPLVQAVRQALAGHSAWELVLVDDGSRDRTASVALAAAAADARIRVVQLARNYGQTQAMQAGFDAAAGDVVVSMDGDLQNDPIDIPRLLAKIDEGYDLVAGYRVRRQDHLIRRKLPSWVANRIIRGLTGIDIRDNGCSLKAYRRETLARMHLYSDMHRFLPALAAATAGARITEIPVQHHPRRFGQSKYGLSRILKILADLLTITMISSFRERPLALFGIGAALSLTFGLGATGLAARAFGAENPDVADAYVLPAVALLFMMLACYLVMLGLLGEVALRRARQSHDEPLPIAVERLP